MKSMKSGKGNQGASNLVMTQKEATTLGNTFSKMAQKSSDTFKKLAHRKLK